MPLQDKEELQRAMANKVPAKIDIGPVYNVDPQRRKAYTGKLLVLKIFIACSVDMAS